MRRKKHLVVLSGAGISAESGIKTFRDSGGLWEGHDVMEVASPEGWKRNPQLVQNFYNLRRKQARECLPNAAHRILADLEEHFEVNIITQNVDDLHERAGSSQVTHLHGELNKAQSSLDPSLVYTLDHWEIKEGDQCAKGSQLRPHIVWFGEQVPKMEIAMQLTQKADFFVVIGTSLQVYPAAGLLDFVPKRTKIYLVDPAKPHMNFGSQMEFIQKTATEGMKDLEKMLKSLI
ncbi:NAD-dependent deacylase [Algoriphagus halophytocola]|uniref:NAD-dependent protein deacylase n=1 Tax=Algoriphagus halophytocola TaxID=2991499 RepID=A0ABY6MJ23_9BACT|nr:MULTISPECIES: NAD-dependent deacylase [unclassified Algoriphagus]UZD23775.1 NAD-dependent deacylase [Algoriphagus sp. TR-M5]WBL45069.1 NAD-dependent deacylase [Algoriphagus sp. TR-M9]